MKKFALVASLALILGCRSIGDIVIDVGQYCREHPEECGKPPAGATPTPTPDPHAAPGRVCGQNDSCCWHDPDDGCEFCWQFIPCPTPTPTATQTPVPTATPLPGAATPTPAPTSAPSNPGNACMLEGPPWLSPAPPDVPVPAEMAVCPKGFRVIDYTDPNSGRFRRACIVDWQCAPGTNGRSLAENAAISIPGHIRLDSDGYVRDVDNGKPCGGDAWGRTVCNRELIPNWESPSGEAWWKAAAACDPPKCAPPPTSGECARAIALNQHFLVGGGGAHAWHPIEGGLVRVVLDTTWRPICDPEHAQNWNDPDVCGHCSHDPDYTVPQGAQLWTVSGAEDRGWNPGNSAQRIIVGKPGAQVKITICPARPVIAPATGTELPIRGDGCSRPDAWNLPGN